MAPQPEGQPGWDLGSEHCWSRGHVNDRGSDALISILVCRQPRGVLLSCSASFAQQQSCPWSSLKLTPFSSHHTHSTFNMACMSCRGPWEVLAPQHVPEGTSLSSSKRSLPWPPHTGLFFPDCDPGDPSLATILAHNCLSGA